MCKRVKYFLRRVGISALHFGHGVEMEEYGSNIKIIFNIGVLQHQLCLAGKDEQQKHGRWCK